MMSHPTPKMVLGGLVLLLVVPEPLDAQVRSQTQATPSVEAGAVQQTWTGLKLTTTTLTTGTVKTGTVTDTGGTGGKVVVTPGGGGEDVGEGKIQHTCVALPCRKCDAKGISVPDPEQDREGCSDGQLCTVGDTCQDGICRSGSQKDCSALGDTCNIGRCDEQSGGCVEQPKADFTVSTGSWETCGGYADSCDETGTQSRTNQVCTSGTLIPQTEAQSCSRETDGTTVSTGNWGTCSGFTDTCDEGGTRSRTKQVCSNGSVTTQPETQNCTRDTDGTIISIGNWGTCGGFTDPCDESGTQSRSRQVCTNGRVASQVENQDCQRDTDNTPIANDGNPCTDDVCQGGQPSHPNDDTNACSDDKPCTENDQCTGGTCAGTPKTCTASDACHEAGTCDPATGRCSNPEKPDPSPDAAGPCERRDCDARTGWTSVPDSTKTDRCDDGNPCTDNDQCSVGTCAGTPVDKDDQNPCTDDTCQDGRPVNTLKSGAECSEGEDCDLQTCTWKNPTCTVTAAGMVAVGQPLEFNLSLSYGGDPTSAVWNPPVISRTDAEGNSFSLPTPSLNNNRFTIADLPTGTRSVTALATVTIAGDRTSEPCSTITEIGSCGMDCTQPNGTKVVRAGDEVFCELTSIEGATCSPPVGSVPAETSITGEVTVSTTCSIIPPGSPTVTFSCDDIAKVNPECTRLNYRIEGDHLIATFEAKGAVRCQADFNGQTEEVMVDEEGRCPEVSFGTPQQPGSYTLTGSVFGNPGSDPDICDPRDVAGPTCHNAIREGAEECDESMADTPTCINCRTVECGDGVPQGAEECDDGNQNNEDECTNDCKRPFCSDGILQRAIGEECDDNNTTAGDGCSPQCKNEPACLYFTPPSSFLYYGQSVSVTVTGQGTRACVGEACAALVSPTAPVTINVPCTEGMSRDSSHEVFTTDNDTGSFRSHCNGHFNLTCQSRCGNGMLDQGEACDPTATAYGWNPTKCDPNCQPIPQEPTTTPPSPGQPVCGNRQVETGEGCDPPDQTTCDTDCHTISTTTSTSGGGGEIQPTDGDGETVDPCAGPRALTLRCLRFSCLTEQQAAHSRYCLGRNRENFQVAPSLSVDRPNQRVYLVRNQETLASQTAAPQETAQAPTYGARPYESQQYTLVRPPTIQPIRIAEIPLCECAAPQRMNVEGTCTNRLDSLPCLHHQQALELSERGVPFDTVDLPNGQIGYQITTPQSTVTLPECPCEEAPVETPQPEPGPQPEPEPEEEEAAGEPPTALEEQPPAPSPPPAPAAPTSPTTEVLGPTQPTPTARTYEVFVCSSGTSVAYGTTSGEERQLDSPCPQLPAEEALAAPQVETARKLGRFLRDRQPGQLDEVRRQVETTLTTWKQGGLPNYPMMAIRVPTEEAGTPAGEPEPASVVAITPNNLEIEVPTDQGQQGPIFHVVNAPTPPAPTTGGPPPQAQGQGPQGGPQAAAMTLSTSDNFYESLAEATNVATTRAVPVVPVETLHAQGACSLIEENKPFPSPLPWTLLLPLLMMGAWRFRPQRLKASISSSINTPKRGFSTKN